MPKEPTEWNQERPIWCPHQSCQFLRRVGDAICGGKLPKPEPHPPIEVPVNTHRFCTNWEQKCSASPDKILDLQVMDADLEYFRWIFDALDGKKTSWLSRREGQE